MEVQSALAERLRRQKELEESVRLQQAKLMQDNAAKFVLERREAEDRERRAAEEREDGKRDAYQLLKEARRMRGRSSPSCGSCSARSGSHVQRNPVEFRGGLAPTQSGHNHGYSGSVLENRGEAHQQRRDSRDRGRGREGQDVRNRRSRDQLRCRSRSNRAVSRSHDHVRCRSRSYGAASRSHDHVRCRSRDHGGIRRPVDADSRDGICTKVPLRRRRRRVTVRSGERDWSGERDGERGGDREYLPGEGRRRR